MQSIFFEIDSIMNLSNKNLIKNHWKINHILTKCPSLSYDYKGQLYDFLSLYENEIDRRIEEDLIEEDEVETWYEFFEDKYEEGYKL